MKKRIIAGIVGLCTILSLVGCGSGEIKNDNITITQYKGFEVEKTQVVKVTDEEVEESIKMTRGIYGIKDRAVAEGDTIYFDYVGKIDGEAFQGGTAYGTFLEIGSGAFIPGFEEAIIGHTPGEDSFDIDVTFPTDYHSAEHAGKAAVFTVTLHSILAELTDDWVASVADDVKTVEEYKAREKKNLQENYDKSAKDTQKQQALTALLEKCVVDKYPEEKLDKLKKELDEYVSYVAAQYGMEKDAYLEASGVSAEEVAKQALKEQLAIELIAEKEKLTLDKDEYKATLKEYAKTNGFENAEQCEEAFGKEELQKMFLRDKVAEFLIENCKLVESTEKEE